MKICVKNYHFTAVFTVKWKCTRVFRLPCINFSLLLLLTIAKFLLPRRVDLRVWNVKKDTVVVSGGKEVNRDSHHKQEHRKKGRCCQRAWKEVIVDIKYQTYVLDSDGDVASLGVAKPSISSVADRQWVSLQLIKSTVIAGRAACSVLLGAQ